MEKPTLTNDANGRVWASAPRTDGPTEAVYPVPGEYGRMLEEMGYKARIVVERVDGGAIQPVDREVLDDASAAAVQHGTVGDAVREAVASGHVRRMNERTAQSSPRLKKTG